jgi:hypothetical protein
VIKIVPLSLKQGGDVMSEGAMSIKKVIPIIVITWILSLVTTLAIAYFTPFIPIETDQIGDSAVTADKILDGAIITTKLDDGTVTSAKILDATITAEDIASGSIITVKVADEAITTAKIADDSITAAKIADGAIVTIKLADDAVTTSKIVDNAIVAVKMADGSVTSAKILDGTIVAADLATGAVTSIKIADGAVTTSKIADYAVTNLKLAANAIPYNFTYATASLTKTTATVENITGMSVEITLERNSTLLIMFSTEARISPATEYIYWNARVNTTFASPGTLWLQPSTTGYYSSISYNFYAEGLTPGKYPVYMQWAVTGGATGQVWYRTLTVIALPT